MATIHHITTALPCQLAQAAKYPNQTVCRNNPTGTARPWRAWLQTDYFSGSFEFATQAEAVAYLAAQVARCPGVDIRTQRKQGVDRVLYRGTFVQHGLEVHTLADIGLVPLFTVELPPAPPRARVRRTCARYSVSFGLAGCYMPDSYSGVYECRTRGELANIIRAELETYSMPASLLREVRLRRLWAHIKRYGSSSLDINLHHRGYVLSFVGLTECDAGG